MKENKKNKLKHYWKRKLKEQCNSEAENKGQSREDAKNEAEARKQTKMKE